jgi:hypothetical protein
MSIRFGSSTTLIFENGEDKYAHVANDVKVGVRFTYRVYEIIFISEIDKCIETNVIGRMGNSIMMKDEEGITPLLIRHVIGDFLIKLSNIYIQYGDGYSLFALSWITCIINNYGKLKWGMPIHITDYARTKTLEIVRIYNFLCELKGLFSWYFNELLIYNIDVGTLHDIVRILHKLYSMYCLDDSVIDCIASYST